ncbi:MAG: diguanylate cyclase [Lysobacterales bacterium]
MPAVRISAWLSRAVRLVAAMLIVAAGNVGALDPDKRFHHYVKDTWSIEEGLPQISALAFAQDTDGYLWVATQAGVARFDGVRFTIFDAKNTPAIPGMFVQTLFVDGSGRLWVGTYKGMARRDRNGFMTIPAKQGKLDRAIEIQQIGQTGTGQIVVTATQGLFEAQGDALRAYPSARPGAAYGLLVDDAAIWVGREGGVEMLDGQGSHWFALSSEDADLRVTRLARTQGLLWAGTSRGLFFRSGDDWQRYTSDPRLAELPIVALHVDGDGNFWVANEQILFRIVGGRVAEVIDADNTAAHRGARAIFHDREGNLWIGSQWDGIARYWNGWTRRYSRDEGLREPVVWSLARDPDGRLWIGTHDGVSVLEGGRIRNLIQGSSLPHPNAYTLLAEPKRLWIGTRGGLAVLEDDRLLPPNPAFAILNNAQVNGLVRDERGLLWIATTRGLFQYDGASLQRHAVKEGPAEPSVRLLFPRSGLPMLIATQDGLFEKTELGLRRVGGATGLPKHIDVTAVYAPAPDRLVIGTLGEQLFAFDGKRWAELGPEHGVPVNSPFFIAHDSLGYLWVTGIRGAFRVPLTDIWEWMDGKRKRVRGEMLLNERGDHRGSQKGFCCNGAGNAKGFIENDTLWLPSRGGVVTISSRAIVKNKVPPPVLIERVRVGEHWTEVAGLTRVDVPLGTRDLSFEFTAPSFQQPRSVRLRYRLRGYDRSWRELADASRRDAVYTNLPPGPYVFEVEAANNAEVWARKSATLAFRIPAHLHETPWLYAAIALVLLGLGVALHRGRLRTLEARKRELEGLVDLRTEDLARVNRILERMSQTDPLTGLRNRHYLGIQLPADLAYYEREIRASGRGDLVLMLAFVDIDHFKSINDRYGHSTGDQMLKEFARIFEAQVRTGDYVLRWGGEEFVLLFRPMPAIEPVRIAERIRRAVASHAFAAEGVSLFNITCSIGFVQYPLSGELNKDLDWEEIIALADLALYYVKDTGRNGWAGVCPHRDDALPRIIEEFERDPASLVTTGKLVSMRPPQ